MMHPSVEDVITGGAPPPFIISPEEMMRFLEPRYIVICPPGLKKRIEEVIARHSLSRLYKVVESPYVKDQTFMFDRQALATGTSKFPSDLFQGSPHDESPRHPAPPL